jgi:hypothetical protein
VYRFIFFSSEMKLLEMEDALPLQNLINRLFEMENHRLSDEVVSDSAPLPCPALLPYLTSWICGRLPASLSVQKTLFTAMT